MWSMFTCPLVAEAVSMLHEPAPGAVLATWGEQKAKLRQAAHMPYRTSNQSDKSWQKKKSLQAVHRY